MNPGARYWTSDGQAGWARQDQGLHGAWRQSNGCGLPRIGRTPLIIAMVFGFILFWPIGLAILGYLWWSGQMVGFGRRANAPEYGMGGASQSGWGSSPSSPWASWFGCRRDATPQSSGNRAFDEYRADTLRRLEDEQKEFAAYLDRLRFAKDKAEFDQFMAERWQRPTTPTGPGQPDRPNGE